MSEAPRGWPDCRVGDWIVLTWNERGEYRVAGEPIAAERVKEILGFLPGEVSSRPDGGECKVMASESRGAALFGA